ncbi:MAG: hypothetical protein WDW36_009536 [Sanguina aurantia]
MAGRLQRDPDADGWERSDMPIVCESCLGPNPFLRMQRIEFGGTCHISGRPYTVFRWRPGSEARYKKTIICKEVAKAKNVCQVCLFDLEFGLPVQVRDAALGMTNDEEAQSDVTKEYQLAERIKNGDNDSSFSQSRPNELLQKLQRTTPYYKRNEAKICSFFVKGECNRGAECPFRHEMPTSGPLSEQNIKDRYYGINDPVAAKMMARVGEMGKLEPPEDRTITTLYLGGLTALVGEDEIKDVLYSYGEISSVRVIPAKMCAFVTFTDRADAEKAAEEMQNKMLVKGTRLRLTWGRPQQQRPDQLEGGGGGGRYGGGAAGGSSSAPSTAAGRPQHSTGQPTGYGSAPPVPEKPYYPSMDPLAQGTRVPAVGDPAKAKRATADSSGASDPKAAPAGSAGSKRANTASGPAAPPPPTHNRSSLSGTNSSSTPPHQASSARPPQPPAFRPPPMSHLPPGMMLQPPPHHLPPGMMPPPMYAGGPPPAFFLRPPPAHPPSAFLPQHLAPPGFGQPPVMGPPPVRPMHKQ